jgi:MraZ protein|tara:strand:- start:4243 stop:4719 length:477 start_codon:yes stop_codon:yes gene_type:complete
MISILGTYECKADTKGRVMLPSGLKKQILPILNEGFVIKRSVFNKCLEIHPMSEWNKIINQVNQLNRFVKKNNDFIRSYMSGLKIVSVDSSSRILIPKDLIKFSGLEKQIVLSSSVNIIEVWDKVEYEQSVLKSLEKFGNLAEDVMGDKSYLSKDDLP